MNSTELADLVLEQWTGCVDAQPTDRELALLRALIEGACAQARITGQNEGFSDHKALVHQIFGNSPALEQRAAS